MLQKFLCLRVAVWAQLIGSSKNSIVLLLLQLIFHFQQFNNRYQNLRLSFECLHFWIRKICVFSSLIAVHLHFTSRIPGLASRVRTWKTSLQFTQFSFFFWSWFQWFFHQNDNSWRYKWSFWHKTITHEVSYSQLQRTTETTDNCRGMKHASQERMPKPKKTKG